MIVDSHCHAGQGDGLTGPWDTDAPLGAYLRRAARAGIGRTVLFAAFNSDYRRANREVGRIVAARPDRFFGYAMVDAKRDAGRIRAMVTEAVTGWGACGIKLHRHDSRITREVCEVAGSLELPVLYDVMGEVATVDLAAQQYEQVQFIVPHLGSFADDWRAQRQTIDLLARAPNVHADSSGIRRFDLLVEAVGRGGAHKLLFGTDGPWLHPGVELAKVRALGLPRDQESLVLGGNWLRLTAAARARRDSGRRPGGPGPFMPAMAAGRLPRRWRPRPPAPVNGRGDPWAGDPFPDAGDAAPSRQNGS
ncbi:MAG: amidohydrolase family protein [Actinomycetota bacterium]